MILNQNIQLSLLLIVLLTNSACDDEHSADPTSHSVIEHLYQEFDFPIGVAVPVGEWENGSIRTDAQTLAIVLTHFNALTAENIMKFSSIHPSAEVYNWEYADWLVDFAEQNTMHMHGHTLVWHNQVPGWLQGFRGNWDSMLVAHINAVVRRYAGRVESWDVVNEAFNDNGTLRETIWKNHIEDYLAKSFSAAREADPNARLFYNDFNISGMPGKLDAVLELVDDFQERGIPIDGIGFQMHILDSWPTADQIETAFERAAATGLLVRISELDVSMNFLQQHTELDQELILAQKERYTDIVRLYRESIPAVQQAGITVWGVTDKYSWIRSQRIDWPLLFDDTYSPKPALEGFANAGS